MISKTYRIFIAMAFIFAAPGLFAIFFYYNPSWLSAVPTHQGKLVTPPKSAQFLGAPKQHWQVLYFCESVCESTCLDGVDALARMRLALGRRLYEVNLLVLTQSQAESSCIDDLKAQAINIKNLDQLAQSAWQDLNLASALNLMDAKGYVILSYPDLEANSSSTSSVLTPKQVKALYQDIKKLLHTQEQAS